ncbi:hypothetical protein ABZ726_05290 [Streptomyces hundungensis]|uniref:hypothetical protein n=1 Tax=Streptomyces hundungensis TaxID=1077946 RepID=UPI0033CF0764
MTTPDKLASQRTAQQRRTLLQTEAERCAAAEQACKEAKAAHARQQQSNHNKQRVLKALLRNVRDMPFKEDRNRAVATLRNDIANGENEARETAALVAATSVAAQAARLELTALRDRQAQESLPVGSLGLAEVATAGPLVTAADGYKATMLRPGWRRPEEGPEVWSYERAENVLSQWSHVPSAWVLRDGDGNLFMASPDVRIELHPVTAPVPNEGDVLRAAFRAYGWPSIEAGQGGVTSVVVPLDPTTPEEAIYEWPHIIIDSDERADRPVAEHCMPWSAHLYDEEGCYVDEVFATTVGGDAARDAVACAAGVASWIERQQRPSVGQSLRDTLAALGINSFVDLGDGSSRLVVPLHDGHRHAGPRLIVCGFTGAPYSSVEMPVGVQRAMAVYLIDGERDTERALYSADGSDLAPCLRFIVRWIVAGDLEEKAREAAATVTTWETERARLLADRSPEPGEHPSDCSDLDDLRRPYEQHAFALLEDLRDIVHRSAL